MQLTFVHFGSRCAGSAGLLLAGHAPAKAYPAQVVLSVPAAVWQPIQEQCLQ